MAQLDQSSSMSTAWGKRSARAEVKREQLVCRQMNEIRKRRSRQQESEEKINRN